MPNSSMGERGIAILIGDSSGASGLSTAVLLDQLMKRVQAEEGLAETPLVEEYFDIVAGAGTGAITMTMVGRLGMTTEMAIETFAKLSKEVFSDGKIVGTPPFKASKMEETLKNIVREQTGNEDTAMQEDSATSRKCKTMVFSMPKHNMNAGIPTIFRSYHSNNNQGPKCTTWRALRAATAHPEMFKSMEIEEHGINQPYIDAAMGCGNPIEHVLAEAKRMYPSQRVSCIVSIGSGHPCTIQIPEPSPLNRLFPTSVVVAMRDIATDSEKMAQTMARRFQRAPNVYFRLNVDQGMQSVRLGDWDRLGEIKAHTRAYMQKAETNKLVDRAAKAVKDRSGVISMKYIDGEIHIDSTPQSAGGKECPVPASAYTERHKPIQRAVNFITSDVQDRRVFVFHGLGGAGKTQLALRTVQQTQNRWSEVVYVDATSFETLSSSLKGFAVSRKIGETHEDTIRWLGTHTKPWLMLFDNFDDISLDVQQYFPKGTHGKILITTRAREVVLLAQGPTSEYNVSNMEPDEALRLLITMARVGEGEISSKEKDAAMTLLQDLGYLALAVTQAGAYIWRTSCGFVQYRRMYAMRPKEILEKYSSKTLERDGYEKTVYGTWMMSYQLLSERTQRMFWLLAYLQRDRITQEIFRRAATRLDEFEPVLPLTETDEQGLVDIKEYLRTFLSNDEWDTEAFLTVMAEIMSYSLISYDRVNETYVLHVLVQDWIHTVIPHSPERALAQASFLLAMSVNHEEQLQDYAHRRALVLHVDRVLKCHKRLNQHTATDFGYVLQENARYKRAEEIQIQALEARKKALGDDAEETLGAMAALAVTYNAQGLYRQAEALQVQVFEAMKRLLGKEHLNTLAAMSKLARTYAKQGLYEQAETLQVQALKARKRLLGNKHPDTLCAMSDLAITYSDRGLYKKAEILQVQALEARKQLLGDEHPDTLTAMSNLAVTYSDQGLYKQAELLQVKALEARKQLLGDEHPDTLSAVSNLATTYSNQGLYKQAETLEVQVLKTRKQLLGNEHPDTLSAMSNLALTYSEQGLYSQAEPLQVQVLEARKRLLGDEHPGTLSAMNNLAATYSDQGLYKQAETLQVQAHKARKRLFGDEHPDTLSAMSNLAVTYSDQGLYKQAETLEVLIFEARKRLLGDEHPDTLTAMSNLAVTFFDQGLYKQAELLQVQVLEARKQLLGDEHPGTLSAMSNLATTYSNQNLYKQAEVLQVRVLEARRQLLGNKHPDTLCAMSSLALTYKRLGRSHQSKYKALKAESAVLRHSKQPKRHKLLGILSFLHYS